MIAIACSMTPNARPKDNLQIEACSEVQGGTNVARAVFSETLSRDLVQVANIIPRAFLRGSSNGKRKATRMIRKACLEHPSSDCQRIWSTD
jgi:hypothetical protein